MSTNTLKQALEIVYGDMKSVRNSTLEASKAYTDKVAQEILWKVGEYDITTQNDNTTALVKAAPSGATRVKIKRISGNCVKYAPSTASDDGVAKDKVIPENTYTTELNTLGCMSYKSDNIANITEINYRLATNGTLIQGDNGNTTDFIEVKEGETYSDNIVAYATSNYLSIAYYDSGKVFVSGILANQNVSTITIPSGIAYMRASYRPNLQDNLMINKGSTLLPYQPYFESVRDTKPTSMVVSGTDMPSITKTIPQEIQALEGYGWGINDTCYNYIDFENKKFIQKVARVDLGSLNWNYDSTQQYSSFYNSGDIGAKSQIVGTPNAIISNNYDLVASNGLRDNNKAYTLYNGKVYAQDSDYNSGTAFKTAMSGVYLYYELATPIETDISSYLPADFNKILTNNNYTNIEFLSEYGYDIPNKVSYYGTIKETLCTAINKNDALAVSLTNNEAKYGWSAGSVYNTRDYTTIKGSQKVGRIKLNQLEYTYNPANSVFFAYINQIDNIKPKGTCDITNYSFKVDSNIIDNTSAGNRLNDKQFAFRYGTTDRLYFKDLLYTDGTTFKNHFGDTDYLYFELGEEIIEDITPLDNNVIEVVENDELGFVNSENQAVPSEITYRIEVEK